MSDTSQNSVHSEEKKNNKVVIIVLVLLVIIVIALVGVIAFLLGRGTTEKSDETAASTERTRQVVESVKMVLDEESAQNVMQQMREEVEEGMFECQMSMKWNFPDGQSTSKDAYVANSTNNRFPFYFDVRLDDTDELVYSSAVMPVGTELKNIKLDKELPAGTYKAIVYYTLVRDTETQEAISTAGFGITITVQN